MVIGYIEKKLYDDLNPQIIVANYLQNIQQVDKYDINRLYNAVFTRLIILIRIAEKFQNNKDQSFMLGINKNLSSEDMYMSARMFFKSINKDFLTGENEISLENDNNNAYCKLIEEKKKDSSIEEKMSLPKTTINKKKFSLATALNQNKNNIKSELSLKLTDDETHHLNEQDIIPSIFLLLSYINTPNNDWIKLQEFRYFCLKVTLITQGFSNKIALNKLLTESTLKLVDFNIDDELTQYGIKSNYICVSLCESISEFLWTNSAIIYKGYVYLPEKFLPLLLLLHYNTVYDKLADNILANYSIVSIWQNENAEIIKLVQRLRLINFDLIQYKNTGLTTVENNFEHLSLTSMTSSIRKFPPCMIKILQSLAQYKILKHSSRLQLWPFLKDCGMTLDEQTKFMESSWGDKNKFDKEHRYAVKHIYGLEGKRQERSCYNCSKIIADLSISKSLTYSGCFFKTAINNDIEDMCRYYNVNDANKIEIIKSYSTNNEYQLACRTLFEYIYPNCDSTEIGIKPQMFFISSSSKADNIIAE